MKQYVISNQKYGKLTAIRVAFVKKHQEYWLFVCDCGQEKVKRAADIYFGLVKSCGCILTKKRTGVKKLPEYAVWNNARQRCHNVKHKAYPDYGGRGIEVCNRWRFGDGKKTGFECFFSDIGPRSKGGTLDRIDNDGNYEPGNVKWSTMQEQSRNRRSSSWFCIQGSTKTGIEWSQIFGICYTTALDRIGRGWDVERAFREPPRKLTKRKS